jgi:hypothetical protein
MQRETVIIERPGVPLPKGEHGAAPAPRSVEGCVVWPRTTLAYESRGEVPIDGWNVKMPAGTDVNETDRVKVRGKTYDCEGIPADYGRKGVIVVLKRIGVS